MGFPCFCMTTMGDDLTTTKIFPTKPLLLTTEAVRELGSERRETVRSLSVVGGGDLRGPVLSTRGPGWTNLL